MLKRHSHSLACKGTPAAAAKRRHHQEDTQRDSRQASTFFGQQPASIIVVPSSFCHGSTVVGALSKRHCQMRAVAGKPAFGRLRC